MEKLEKDGKDMVKKNAEKVSSQEEEKKLLQPEGLDFTEAEWSIDEKDIKRKNGKQAGNKPKRRRMEKLEGWGLRKDDAEDISEEEKGKDEAATTRDWITETVVIEQNNHQTDLSNWLGINKELDNNKDETLPAGRKDETEEKKIAKEQTLKRRKNGKLTKEEIQKMKACHKDIATMFSWSR